MESTIPEAHARRTRRACEPCRRKKSKCTGERPICSFCERLDLPCKYAIRGSTIPGDTTKVHKSQKTSTKDRIQALESQVASLSRLLGSGGKEAIQSPSALQVINPAIRLESTPLIRDSGPDEQQVRLFSEEQTVHLQPLPLFELASLEERLQNAPRYILHSFLALMLEFSTHRFYQSKHAEAASYYNHSAAATTKRLAAEGQPRVEIVQALCMIAFRDLAVSELSRAWMTLGTAIRLESIRSLYPSNSETNHEQHEKDRCYWSIRMIEAIFFPHMPSFPSLITTWKHPPSAEPPRPISLSVNEANAPDFDNAVGAFDDLGINTHAGQMVEVWSQVACHLHEIRSGEIQIPWLPDSKYSRLNLALFEYEAQFHQRHLMRNLFPFKRPPDEIETYREYWNPWLTTHLILHASLALLNHPFIHLVALHHNKGVSQSRLFLQQVVDQALFHSGWVFWLVGIFENLSFEIHNPLIGLAVAATSTIPWLYQFVRNTKIAHKATQNFDKAKRLLQRLSETWPCMSRKVESLKRLQSLVIERSPEAGNADTTITFPPSMIWELLDPVISNAELPTDTLIPSTEGLNVSIHVTMDFLHPLVDDEDEPISSHFDWENYLGCGNELLQDMYPASLVPFDFNNA
ncbi:hypothetical protein FBEOM_14053 [Fusarium beomiforme]|uniref:Zn(2)-C6 fungal-type domain-containing protein n=1 Tax=Fusarium beomiforme TaxID=44412 RepID=A0A9P5A574_9HYPO|nr:hypothetical protein FBEOM_14053 [Fusarium beomiforme]